MKSIRTQQRVGFFLFLGGLLLPLGCSFPAIDLRLWTPLADDALLREAGDGWQKAKLLPPPLEQTAELAAVEGLQVVQTNASGVGGLSVARSGEQAYLATLDGRVIEMRILQSRGQALSLEMREIFRSSEPISGIAVSPDNRRLAVAQFSSVKILDLATFKVSAALSRVEGRIPVLAWDPRGEFLALGRANGDVYLWDLGFGPFAGDDSDNALELYQLASSPIIGLVFHPSGRTFFAAEREGRIYAWRLLRTEQEMGLLDKAAEIDRKRKGRKAVMIAQLSVQIADMRLEAQRQHLLVAGSDGKVYRWKVRGLRQLDALQVGEENVQSITVRAGALLFAAGRGQRLQVWCEDVVKRSAVRSEVVVIPAPMPTPEPDLSASSEGMEAEDGAELFGVDPTPTVSHAASPPGLLFQSPVLKEAVNSLQLAPDGRFLWGALRSGMVLIFDVDAVTGAKRCDGS